MRRGRGWLTLTGLAFAACAETKIAPPTSGLAKHVPGTICGGTPRARADDRCSVLRDPFDERDVDGCPDATIEYEANLADVPETAASTLTELAGEMRRLDRVADVVIIGVPGDTEDHALVGRRVERVIATLERLGIPRRRFSRGIQPTRHGPGYLVFEPYACADGTCASQACLDGKRPGQ